MSRFILFALACVAWLASTSAVASGGSYLVDDASITPASHCQLESWVQMLTHSRTVTTVPACSWGAVEFSAALSAGVHAGTASVAPEVKWALAQGQQLGTALAVGTTLQGGRAHDTYAYSASTFSLDSAGRWVVDADVGLTRERGRPVHRLLGAGVEFAASSAMTLIAEVLDTAGAGRTWQAGVRLPFGDDSVDLVMGRRLVHGSGNHAATAADRWVTAGVNLAF